MIMSRWIFLGIATLISPWASAEPQWPEQLDVDFNYRNSAPLQTTDHWDIRLGLGVEREPTFQGSDKSQTEPDIFAVVAYRSRYGTFFFSGDGLGYSRLISPSFGLLLQLEAEDTREIDDDDRLTGLGDQNEELELEIVGNYFAGPWRAGASVAVATGDKGFVWFVGGGYIYRSQNERLFLNFRGDLSGSDKSNQQTDFGITAEQSQNSTFGYPAYSPDGGLKSFGLGLTADYQLSKKWFLNAEVEYERLLDDIADSPLIRLTGSENSVEVGFSFYYRF